MYTITANFPRETRDVDHINGCCPLQILPPNERTPGVR